MARDGDNHLKLQLHRVGLDGTGDVRLTDPAFNHTVGSCLPVSSGPAARFGGAGAPCGISPDNRYFIDVYQTHDTPPATRLVDARAGSSGRRARQERPDEVRRARPEEGGDVHLQRRRRPDAAARPHPVSIRLRPVAELPRARGRLRRAGVGEQHRARDLRHAEPAHRVRLPAGQPGLAGGARHGQAHAGRDLPQARPGRDRRYGRRREGALGSARTSTRRAWASTGPPTAATRR